MTKKIYKIAFIAIITISISFNGFAQKTLKNITQRGELRVGMTATQPPFCMKAKDGTTIGYEVDLATMLAESMGVKLNIVELPFSELLTSLESGNVDVVMSGMTITMERNMKVSFVGPYLLSGKSILTRSASFSDTDESSDLNDGTIKLATLKGSTGEEYVKMEMPDAELTLVSNYDEGINALMEKKVDILIADYPICAYTALLHPEKGLITLDKPLTIEPIGMAMPANDAHFLNLMQNYMNTLTMMGVLDLLEMAWFESGEWTDQVK